MHIAHNLKIINQKCYQYRFSEIKLHKSANPGSHYSDIRGGDNKVKFDFRKAMANEKIEMKGVREIEYPPNGQII